MYGGLLLLLIFLAVLIIFWWLFKKYAFSVSYKTEYNNYFKDYKKFKEITTRSKNDVGTNYLRCKIKDVYKANIVDSDTKEKELIKLKLKANGVNANLNILIGQLAFFSKFLIKLPSIPITRIAQEFNTLEL